ncbi:6-phosphogluconolactonase [Endozoicomonas ascidiicola]|uniref:6-phosphogluconolactonase n=1 Tax=Endozoicomonas ascidiicola TaxID=1698521 RepID=UPI000A4EA3A7|nr:6-phosphogluconolactonase [Endozoicomonas ascidiicola]
MTAALVDERWVEEDNPASNAAFLKQSLLKNCAAQAAFIGMKNDAVTAKDGLEHCEQAYQKISQPFDLTILGMGADGHTASLFPKSHGLEYALKSKKLCADIKAQPSDVFGGNLERMSLTLHGLLQSTSIILLITGDEKMDVYRRALNNSDYINTPVSAVFWQSEVPVDVYWSP